MVDAITSQKSVLHWSRFLNAILIITFALSIISFTGILHYAIGVKFNPSSVKYSQFYFNAMLSTLAVAYPIFAAVFLFVQKKIAKDPSLARFHERTQALFAISMFMFVILVIRLIFFVFTLISDEINTVELVHIVADLVVLTPILFYTVSGLRKNSSQQ